MATFLVGSENNVRQQGPLPAGPVRPSGPCCLGVAEAPFLSLESSQTATFLVGSESTTLGSRSVAGRPGPSFRALLLGRGGGAVAELGKLEDGYFSCRFRKQR